ncbi:hypothetical protein M9Y10_022356 [Tritrichomonas musculus]|uniref:Uncharacterized protein n=1 Tax=Tritrichomonas musculus TaxID=1915356 RepID=A0ABR2KU14_9EUKA
MTMFTSSNDEISSQIFDFMTNLPFVHCTRHISVERLQRSNEPPLPDSRDE